MNSPTCRANSRCASSERKELERSMTNDAIINPVVLPSGTGCAECLVSDGWWLHLLRGAPCGHVGCCDSSPSQHASQHAASAAHPIVQSFEPSEDWFWNYRT